MSILVTGGAGFIGRWVVKKLLDEHEVIVLDNLINGGRDNIKEFIENPDFSFIHDDILNNKAVNAAFDDVDLCIHSAAQINVQESLDSPEKAFKNNVIGTYNVLEACRKNGAKLVLMGTCMVYDIASLGSINEDHSLKPASPYAGSKVAAEELAMSYFHGYGLPVVVVRPFNTYGPFQKSNMEGGVVSIFIRRYLEGKKLQIYGDGTQTRDLLYVEDCADFIVKSALSERAVGEVINAGTGKDVSINDLAMMICNDEDMIEHMLHHHPQAEIQKLVCDNSKARKLLGWEPETSLKEGIEKTMEWIKQEPA
ncbi:UDP-glucose 4-epimerase [archaeon BMS3Abin16]|nr:UDP-glucose 4-epimerase [archaeon BMS3Abin16]